MSRIEERLTGREEKNHLFWSHNRYTYTSFYYYAGKQEAILAARQSSQESATITLLFIPSVLVRTTSYQSMLPRDHNTKIICIALVQLKL